MKKACSSLMAGLLLTGLAVLPGASRAAVACTGDAPVTVGSTTAGNVVDPAAEPAFAAAGLSLKSLQLHTVCAPVPAVEFIINLNGMTAAPPPEVVRYFWQFTINDHEYWVQAKTSDISSPLMLPDDPQGQLTHLSGAFRLRGQCAPVGTVINCKHLAWLSGTFDVAAKQVRVLVPLGISADFASGNVVTPSAPLGKSPGAQAAIQAVTSNGNTSEYMPQNDEYTIAP